MQLRFKFLLAFFIIVLLVFIFAPFIYYEGLKMGMIYGLYVIVSAFIIALLFGTGPGSGGIE